MRYTLEEKVGAVALVRGGMTYREASRACGIPHQRIWDWRRRLDAGGRAPYPLPRGRKRPERGAVVDMDRLPDDPEELKRIIREQRLEIDLTRAVVDILKKDPGVDPATLSNKEKATLVDALARRGPRYTISSLASSLRLAPATFYYHRRRTGRDEREKEALRARVLEVSAEHPEYGYRRVKRALDAGGDGFAHVSEKRVRRVMRDEGVQPPRRRRRSRYSSYDPRADKGESVANVPLREDGTHDFGADAPNRLWVSDVTEFPLPDGERVYLSPVLDCFDSSLVGWETSTSERADDLTNPSLEMAARRLGEGDRCVVHTDRGGQYFSSGWLGTCERFGVVRSMSRKGRSPDNARMEGFFGRLKMEFFDVRDWSGKGADEFMEELDAWLRYYNEERPKESLGWLSPMQYRRRYFEAA